MRRRWWRIAWLLALALATLAANASDLATLRHALDLGDLRQQPEAPPAPPWNDAQARYALAWVEWQQRVDAHESASAVLAQLRRWSEAEAAVGKELRAAVLVLESRQSLQQAQLTAAQREAADALALLEGGDESLALARALAQLARAQRAADKRSEALATSERAVDLYARLAPASNEALWVLVDRIGILRTGGRFEESRRALEQAEAWLAADAPDVELRAMLANQRAIVHINRSELPAARNSLASASALLSRVPHAAVLRAVVRQNLALVTWDLGDLGLARTQLLGALEDERRLRPGSLALARALINAGRLHFELGDLEQAGADYAQAQAIVLELAAGQAVESYLRANQAELAAARGDNEQARSLFERAIAVDESQPRDCYCAGPTLRDYALFLGSLGEAGAREALALLPRVRKLLDAFGNRNIEVLLVDRQEARLRLAVGELDAAALLARRARRGLAQRVPLSPNHALALHTEGLVARAQGRPRAARTALCRAVEVLERVDLDAADGALAHSQFRARHADLYHDCVGALVAAGEPAAALDVLEQGRARSLLSLWRGHASALAGEPQSAVDAWIEYRQRRAAALAQAGDPELDATAAQAARVELQALDREYEVALARLIRAAPRTAALLVPRTGSRLHRRVPADALLLAYSVGADETWRLAATVDGVAAERLVLGRSALAARVQQLRQLVLRRDPGELRALHELAGELHALLLGPQGSLPRSRLLVLADGPLLQLPFGALYDRERGAYALASAAIVQVESISALALAQRARDASGALVVADPEPAAAGLPALPGASSEAAGVQRVLRGPVLLLRGESASEERIKREIGGAGLLHFAVHGVLDEAVPLDSALMFAAGGGEDGALRVREILGLAHLRAELVVLSACNSAVGSELRGDGLVSLTRAFRQAGARRVLATLWPIADQGSAALMAAFHGARANGVPAAEALRTAQLALIGSTAGADGGSVRAVGGLSPAGGTRATLAHPYFWAGFQLYGQVEAR